MGEVLNHIVNLIEGHLQLAHLEFRYEHDQSRRRFWVLGLVILCGLWAFLFLHIALLIGLAKAGLPLYAICLFLGGVYAGAGALIYRRFGIRETRAGEPFQGSRDELNRSLKWIHQLLS